MTYVAIITKIILSFSLAASILYRYGNWYRHRIFVTLVVLLAWYFSFLIIFALPLDVISTVYRQCVPPEHIAINVSDFANVSTCEEPWSHVPEEVFPKLWRTVYWTSQILTWLLMPMMQSYIKAGDFTIKGKLKSAVIDNAIYYGSYLFICGILLIYLALKPGVNLDWPKLKAIASSASNTWGLLLLVLLLGYALVEVPRSLWNNSYYTYVINYAYFKAAKLSSDKCEAEETVDDVLESLQAISLAVRPGHPLHHNLETILHKVPIELRDRMSRRQLPEDTPIDVPSEKSLIRLHKQVIKSLQVLQRTETQWKILVEKIFALEDVLKNLTSMDRRFKHTFPKPKSTFVRFIYSPLIEWYWKCFLRCYVQKVLAVLAAILSVAVVWSEVTFFNKDPPLSIFAIIVSNLKYDYFAIELLSTIVILYLCYCAYSTVLKIRLLNLYYLAPHHQTNEYSLIFSGMMLSRLTAPLCLNFLGLIHMDSHIIKKQMMETDYTRIMGHMDVIGIISDGFNVYFPIAILLFCLATYFSLGARLLSMIGFHQFVGDDEITTDLVDDGRELIKREKRKRERAEESSNRKQDFHQRYPVISRYRIRNSNDTVRPVTRELVESTRSNLLKDGGHVESYEGTRFNSSDVDTSFPPDSNEDISTRFGVSTHKIINERFDSSEELDPRFSDSYQSHNYKRVGPPPRGIFDDV